MDQIESVELSLVILPLVQAIAPFDIALRDLKARRAELPLAKRRWTVDRTKVG